MKLLWYKVLTQIIILVAKLRSRLEEKGMPVQVRMDRTFDFYTIERWNCCDCGLAHYYKAFDPGEDCDHDLTDTDRQRLTLGAKRMGHMWPIRPVGYDYSWRFQAETSDLAKDKK